jgi:NAD(P)H dehydrogenase (quinone)
MRPRILVLYYSRSGSTAELARHVARGIEAAGADAVVRTVPSVTPEFESRGSEIPVQGPPYATVDDLRECAGLVLGSPTRFGNMAAPLKYFLEQTSDLWLSGTLVDKPAGVFTSSSSAHGGQESTLLTMALPLVHHGMIWVGVPYTSSALFSTQAGGGPYGASHLHNDRNLELSADETRIAHDLGHRVADIALRLARA